MASTLCRCQKRGIIESNMKLIINDFLFSSTLIFYIWACRQSKLFIYASCIVASFFFVSFFLRVGSGRTGLGWAWLGEWSRPAVKWMIMNMEMAFVGERPCYHFAAVAVVVDDVVAVVGWGEGERVNKTRRGRRHPLSCCPFFHRHFIKFFLLPFCGLREREGEQGGEQLS